MEESWQFSRRAEGLIMLKRERLGGLRLWKEGGRERESPNGLLSKFESFAFQPWAMHWVLLMQVESQAPLMLLGDAYLML